MKFVDRINEQERLRKALSKDERQFVVVYGRRRIGKSALVKRVMRLATAEDVYFQADETSMVNQLYLLSKAIATVFPTFDAATYPDWRALLDAFNYRVTEPCTLCLDEFPYLCKSCPSLPSVLQDFLDNAEPRFNLLLCGSSQQLMYSEVLSATSPLYGRADVIIKLQPIGIGFIQEAMEIDTARQAVEQYALWGGVPRYWKLAKNCGTASGALCELLLTSDGTLADEPTRLLRDDLRELTLSRSLLATIGYGANRLSEIAARLNKQATELSAPLRRLIDMGYIERETPFGENSKDSKRSLYKICDPFMNTYYRFHAPNASLIAMGRSDALELIVEREMPSFVAGTWERLCRQAVSGHELDGVVYGAASRWWGMAYDAAMGKNRQIEIDVAALSLDHRHMLVGECKWTAADYAGRLLAELEAKAQLMPRPKSVKHIHYVLFLRERPKGDIRAGVYLPDDVVAMC